MTAKIIYYYKKTRKEQSIIFIRMGMLFLVYIAGIYGYEYFLNKKVPEDLRSICLIAFSIASIILLYVAWWLRAHPSTYEATITYERFVINYPDSPQWSFDIKISDIKRFEHRNTLSSGGRGIGASGVLLNDGSFHEICMNYGNNIKKMYAAIKSINQNIEFSNKVNLKVSGPLNKDYDE